MNCQGFWDFVFLYESVRDFWSDLSAPSQTLTTEKTFNEEMRRTLPLIIHGSLKQCISKIEI